MLDFTLQVYSELLQQAKTAYYNFCTFEKFLSFKPIGKTIILRHDIDRKPENALIMAQLENKLGIQASYYFRIVKQSNNPEVIKRIARLGHEIGYHYEDLTLAKGHYDIAIISFERNLEYFRQFYPIKTIWRGFRSILTFDPVKKVELELRYANEKLIEAKQVAEEKDKPEIVVKALERYKKDLENAVMIEAKKVIPLDLNEMILDWKIIEAVDTKASASTNDKKDEKNEQKYKGFSMWRIPQNWTLTTSTNFYGKYVRSAYYVKSGTGDRKAVWSVPVKESGYHDVYYYLENSRMPNFNRGKRDNSKGEVGQYQFFIHHDDGVDEANLNLKDLAGGWNHLGSFHFSPDTRSEERRVGKEGKSGWSPDH